MKKPYSKYKAKKVTVDGIEFASTKEANRYKELKILEKAGKIKNLQLQVPFVLIPAQYVEEKQITKRGKEKIVKKLVEQQLKYIADFTYFENDKMVVEDVKGYRGGSAYQIFKIKKKLMLWVHNIKIVEI